MASRSDLTVVRLQLAAVGRFSVRAVPYGIIKKLYGEVTEWFKVTVLKTVVGQLTASSNLALSAI